MNKSTNTKARHLEIIRNKMFDGMYDHMNEKGCTEVTDDVMGEIDRLLKNQRQQLIQDSLNKWFEIIKEVNQKLFMYETLMGKIEGDDVAKQFIEYQELEPERTKFADWLETQREILETMEKKS